MANGAATCRPGDPGSKSREREGQGSYRQVGSAACSRGPRDENKKARVGPIALKGDHEMTNTHDTTVCLGCVGLLLEGFGMIALSALAFAAPLIVPILFRATG